MVNAGDLVVTGMLRPVVTPIALVLGLALGVLSGPAAAPPRGRGVNGGAPPDVPGDVAAVTVALAAGWMLTAPYALPWYVAIAWAPLALAPATFLDRALLAQLTVLTLAYVPGLVGVSSPAVDAVTLGLRRYPAPALLAAVVVAVVVWCVRGKPAGR